MNQRLAIPLWILAIGLGGVSALSVAFSTQSPPHILASCAFMVAAVCLVVWRWDKHIHAPECALAIGLLAAGAVCGVAGTLLDIAVLSSLTFTLTVGSFLSSHYESRNQRRMTHHVAPFALAVCMPPAFAFYIDNGGQQSVLSHSENLLSFFSIPYFVLQPANAIFTKTDFVSVESVWNSWTSWQFLAGCILLHQAALRRSGIVLLLNMLLVVPLTIMLHTTAIFFRFVAAEWYAVDFSSPSAWMACVAASMIVVLLAFVSAERFLLGLCYPIASSFETAQANPIVVIWNRMFAAKSRASKLDGPSRHPWLGKIIAPIAIAGIVVAGVLQITRLPSMAARPIPAQYNHSNASRAALSTVFEDTPVFHEDFAVRLTSAMGPRRTWLFPHLVQPVTLTLFEESVNLDEVVQHGGFQAWNVVRKETIVAESTSDVASPVEIIEMSSSRNSGSIVTLMAHVDAQGRLVPAAANSDATDGAVIRSIQMTVHSMLPEVDTNLKQLTRVLQLASAATFKR